MFDTVVVRDLSSAGLLAAACYALAAPSCGAQAVAAATELASDREHLERYGVLILALDEAMTLTAAEVLAEHHGLSRFDIEALLLAERARARLLTNERLLTQLARLRGVEAHGSLWVVQMLWERRVIDPAAGLQAILAMIERGSRLPQEQVGRLRRRFKDAIALGGE